MSTEYHNPTTKVVTSFETQTMDQEPTLAEYETQLEATARHDKNSVDTGSFVPGVYRVNVYDAAREVFHSKNHTHNIEWEANGGLTRYKLKSEGHVLLKALDDYKNYQLPGYTDPDKLRQIALVSAVSKLDGSILDAGVELGELKETIAMLRNPLSGLRTFLKGKNWKNVKPQLLAFATTGRYDGRSGLDALKAATNTWMEIRYGLRPLIGSIEDVCKLVKAKDKRFLPSKIRTVRGSAQDDVVGKTFSRTFTHVPIMMYSADFTWRRDFTATAAVQYTRDFEQTSLGKLGLTLPQLPSIAWNLTKLSYLSDWFYDIGSWIQAHKVTPGITVLGNAVGLKETRSLLVTGASGYPNVVGGTNNVVPLASGDKYVRESYDRDVGLTQTKYPIWKGTQKLDFFKVVDMCVIGFQRSGL